MAKENKKTDQGKSSKGKTVHDSSKSYLFEDIFAAPICEEPSTQQIFADDQIAANCLNPDDQPAQPSISQPIPTAPVATVSAGNNRFSLTQKLLAAAIFVIASVMAYSLLRTPQNSLPQSPVATPILQPPQKTVQVADPDTTTPQDAVSPSTITGPVSLVTAQNLFTQEKYIQAFEVYDQLNQQLSQIPDEKIMNDFLLLQMARCSEKTADNLKAANIYKKLFSSESPAIRIMANYRTSLLEMQKKQFLVARTKAYQAIALADAVDYDSQWALTVKKNGSFLAAQALTSQILSLTDADKDLPAELWASFKPFNDPFIILDNDDLKEFLSDGKEKLTKAILAPDIHNLGNNETITRFDITCNNAAIDELMARFSANTQMDLCWNLENEDIGIRKRMAYLYLPSVTAQQFVTVAAGSTGLLALVDQNDVINLYNPAKYSYMSKHLDLLTSQAVSLWQNFMLRFPADPRLADIHFALGLLYQQNNRPTEAIAEYKLLANQFARSPLATFALMNSSQLKTSMHDYAGGRLDLKQLVEQYPDAPINEIAYLHLALATAKTGQYEEAANLYKKAYNLTFNPQYHIQSAIGAGRCFYQMQEYTAAEIWLNRHILASQKNLTPVSYQTFVLLGKTYQALDKTSSACGAFQHALKAGTAKLSKEEYMELIYALVDNYMKQQKFIEALDTVENVYSGTLSNEEHVKILLLKSRIFRNMHLPVKALSLLTDKAEYMTEPQLKAEILYELSHCYIEAQDFDGAYENLTKALVTAKSESLMHQVALDLAKLCLQLDRNNQTVFVCSQLLDMNPDESVKQQALKLLAAAYDQQKDYDNAALALMGKWK